MARLSIGILAHNEGKMLEATLTSLFSQRLFASGHDCEVLVVPNGCTDDTAQVANRLLAKAASSVQLTWKVCEVAKPGKSNAWNVYVHELSRKDAEFLFLMDADITLIEDDTLGSMVDTLERDPDAWIAIDTPIKDIQLKAHKTLGERLSLKIGGTPPSDAICGQLYCGRAAVLRDVWMPEGLPVEDGFLRAVVDTDHFLGLEGGAGRRIRLAPRASHAFEALTDLRALMRHEKRLVIGTTINRLIFGHLWRTGAQGRPAGSVVALLNAENPRWVQELVDQRLQSGGWWVVPASETWRRLAKLRCLPRSKALTHLPIACAATALDLIVFFQASVDFNRGRGLGFW